MNFDFICSCHRYYINRECHCCHIFINLYIRKLYFLYNRSICTAHNIHIHKYITTNMIIVRKPQENLKWYQNRLSFYCFITFILTFFLSFSIIFQRLLYIYVRICTSSKPLAVLPTCIRTQLM